MNRFDEKRLARVGAAVKGDIEANRCDGVALIVAHKGEVVLDLIEGYADRKAGRRLARLRVLHLVAGKAVHQRVGIVAGRTRRANSLESLPDERVNYSIFDDSPAHSSDACN